MNSINTKRLTRFTLLFAGLIVFLSLISLIINYCFYQFPGNNYFPENTLLLAFLLFLIYYGLVLLFGKKSLPALSGLELLYFFLVMSIIALATNAIQLTPFSPIDKYIIQFEKNFSIEMAAILKWMHHVPFFKQILIVIYDTLPYQMAFLPLCVIALGRFDRLREYYFMMFFTALIGFAFYYFFPTTAPASVINSPYFLADQLATGLKFNQIHQHITPTTIKGGMIALPSFHAIWALMCVYLIRAWTIPCVLLAINNFFLIASCILLGWHYPSDIVAGVILWGMGFGVLRKLK